MIGSRIKELRKSINLTQKQLANKLKVDCSAVTKWETGKANPDFENQKMLASFFGVSIDYLLGVELNKTILSERLSILLDAHCPYDYTPFAESIGVSVSTVIQWTRGISHTCYAELDKIADFFNVSINYLLGYENSCENNPEKDEGITIYNKLDTEDKAEIRGTMKQMLKADKYTTSQSEPPKHIPFANRRTQPQLAAYGHEVEIIDK